ncbi:hypothetical protein GGI07_000052 [Coemansia sp. Benny D115]|nr:hypothetical protein GGI07_000052 [Coemansia sp. Benny D115]
MPQSNKGKAEAAVDQRASPAGSRRESVIAVSRRASASEDFPALPAPCSGLLSDEKLQHIHRYLNNVYTMTQEDVREASAVDTMGGEYGTAAMSPGSHFFAPEEHADAYMCQREHPANGDAHYERRRKHRTRPKSLHMPRTRTEREQGEAVDNSTHGDAHANATSQRNEPENMHFGAINAQPRAKSLRRRQQPQLGIFNRGKAVASSGDAGIIAFSETEFLRNANISRARLDGIEHNTATRDNFTASAGDASAHDGVDNSDHAGGANGKCARRISASCSAWSSASGGGATTSQVRKASESSIGTDSACSQPTRVDSSSASHLNGKAGGCVNGRERSGSHDLASAYASQAEAHAKDCGCCDYLLEPPSPIVPRPWSGTQAWNMHTTPDAHENDNDGRPQRLFGSPDAYQTPPSSSSSDPQTPTTPLEDPSNILTTIDECIGEDAGHIPGFSPGSTGILDMDLGMNLSRFFEGSSGLTPDFNRSLLNMRDSTWTGISGIGSSFFSSEEPGLPQRAIGETTVSDFGNSLYGLGNVYANAVSQYPLFSADMGGSNESLPRYVPTSDMPPAYFSLSLSPRDSSGYDTAHYSRRFNRSRADIPISVNSNSRLFRSFSSRGDVGRDVSGGYSNNRQSSADSQSTAVDFKYFPRRMS